MSNMYAYGFTGIGPQRALHERVSHIVYMFHIIDNNMQMIPCSSEFINRLKELNIHYTNHIIDSTNYVSIYRSTISRNWINESNNHTMPGGFLTSKNEQKAWEELAQLLTT